MDRLRKGIAIILVVYRHVAYGLLSSNVPLYDWVKDFNDMLYSFRIPLFVMLSGVFFGKSLHRHGPRELLINKVNTLLYPYLLWAVIQITLQIIFSNYANSQRSLGDYLYILTQPRALDQLWYLFLLFNVTALYLLFSQLLRAHTQWQLFIGLGLLALAPLMSEISTFYDIALHYIFFAIGQFSATWLLNENIQNRISRGRLLLPLLPLFIGMQYLYLQNHVGMNLYLYMIVAVVGSVYTITLSIFLVRWGIFKWLQVIGKYSLIFICCMWSYLRHCGYHCCAPGCSTPLQPRSYYWYF